MAKKNQQKPHDAEVLASPGAARPEAGAGAAPRS